MIHPSPRPDSQRHGSTSRPPPCRPRAVCTAAPDTDQQRERQHDDGGGLDPDRRARAAPRPPTRASWRPAPGRRPAGRPSRRRCARPTPGGSRPAGRPAPATPRAPSGTPVRRASAGRHTAISTHAEHRDDPQDRRGSRSSDPPSLAASAGQHQKHRAIRRRRVQPGRRDRIQPGTAQQINPAGVRVEPGRLLPALTRVRVDVVAAQREERQQRQRPQRRRHVGPARRRHRLPARPTTRRSSAPCRAASTAAAARRRRPAKIVPRRAWSAATGRSAPPRYAASGEQQTACQARVSDQTRAGHGGHPTVTRCYRPAAPVSSAACGLGDRLEWVTAVVAAVLGVVVPAAPADGVGPGRAGGPGRVLRRPRLHADRPALVRRASTSSATAWCRSR